MEESMFPLTADLNCDCAEAEAYGAARHENYKNASPFPHIVIDDFLEPEILRRVITDLQTLPKPDRAYNRAQERLKTQYNPDLLPHSTRSLFYFFNSKPFVVFLEWLTGIGGLMPDPHFDGGGIHRIEPGGHLSIHADFNHHLRTNTERRLNVIVYLNENWKSEYGSQLELWDRSMDRCVRSIEPLFNRCVIFNTSSFSFHGNPNPVTHPEGKPRLSMALYYYTATWDGSRREHTTQFKVRPGTGDKHDWSIRRRELLDDWMPPVLRRNAKRYIGKVSSKLRKMVGRNETQR